MKQMEISRFGLHSLNPDEMREIDGGKKGWLSRLVRGITGLWVLEKVVDNWDEIKQGFSNGWNFDKPTK